MPAAAAFRAIQSGIFTPILNFIFPPRCPTCAAPLAVQGGLCVECWGKLAVPTSPWCRRCQMPFTGVVPPGRICDPCRAEPPLHAGIAAATLYGGPARDMVLGLKHGCRLALAPLMARLMAARLGGEGLPRVDADWLVVPVPLHATRIWRRGFNQSALLARDVARHTGARLMVDGLVRVRRTPSLGPLGRDARIAALAGAVVPHRARAALLAGADVLLVDDVLTSGATSNACIAALRAAGARRVVVACFARVG